MLAGISSAHDFRSARLATRGAVFLLNRSVVMSFTACIDTYVRIKCIDLEQDTKQGRKHVVGHRMFQNVSNVLWLF